MAYYNALQIDFNASAHHFKYETNKYIRIFRCLVFVRLCSHIRLGSFIMCVNFASLLISMFRCIFFSFNTPIGHVGAMCICLRLNDMYTFVVVAIVACGFGYALFYFYFYFIIVFVVRSLVRSLPFIRFSMPIHNEISYVLRAYAIQPKNFQMKNFPFHCMLWCLCYFSSPFQFFIRLK